MVATAGMTGKTIWRFPNIVCQCVRRDLRSIFLTNAIRKRSDLAHAEHLQVIKRSGLMRLTSGVITCRSGQTLQAGNYRRGKPKFLESRRYELGDPDTLCLSRLNTVRHDGRRLVDPISKPTSMSLPIARIAYTSAQ